MKTKLLLVTLLLLSLNAVASNPVRFGIIGGYNNSTFKGGYFDGSRQGFYVGGISEIPIISNNLYFNPSALISLKGDKKYESDALYIDIPLFLKYKCPLSKQNSIFVSGGPILSYGINGDHNSEIGDNSTLFTGTGHPLNPFDCAIGVNAGIELCKHCQFSVEYDFGIINISNNSYYKVHSRNFKISFAYFFGKK